MKKDSKIYIAGHNGMVGSAILRKLRQEGFHNLIYKSSKDLDLRNQSEVKSFFEFEQPQFVFLAAAKVGGIFANNKYRAEFIYDNLLIESNLIHCSHIFGVEKLLYLGSSCIYPKFSKQPIKEEYLLTGELEETNKPYAISKIAGIELCQSYRFQYGSNFICCMPTNLYGTNDNYNLENSHVLPALLRKIISAKKNNSDHVVVWGTGNPRREFMHVDDLASACYFLMLNYNKSEIINVGVGEDISINQLLELISNIIKYEGEFIYDKTKPDGVSQKLLDISKILKLGWKPTISLKEGLIKTIEEIYNDFN